MCVLVCAGVCVNCLLIVFGLVVCLFGCLSLLHVLLRLPHIVGTVYKNIFRFVFCFLGMYVCVCVMCVCACTVCHQQLSDNGP